MSVEDDDLLLKYSVFLYQSLYQSLHQSLQRVKVDLVSKILSLEKYDPLNETTSRMSNKIQIPCLFECRTYVTDRFLFLPHKMSREQHISS